MEEELSNKEKLLRITKQIKKKRKVKKIQSPILSVQGIESSQVVDNFETTYYLGTRSKKVRQSIYSILDSI